MISDGELQKIEEYCMDVNDHTGVRLVQEIRRIREIRYKATEAHVEIQSRLQEDLEEAKGEIERLKRNLGNTIDKLTFALNDKWEEIQVLKMKYKDLEKVAEQLEEMAKKEQSFSEALWNDGDKANAHCREGVAIGLRMAFEIIHRKKVEYDEPSFLKEESK